MKQKVVYAVRNALDLLLKLDMAILEIDINERAISHRLANYLERCFPDWDVDCEYNRNHDDSKLLDIRPRGIKSDDTQAVTVFPDIIVHERGTDNNLLVIEIKKTTSREGDNYDLGKLYAFKRQLGYRFAVHVKVGTGRDTGRYKMKWIE